ncbi:MAG: Sec-independent protein translocase protein TatB [Rhodobacteraceae bacterium]|uniref:Sec-independent protein translocase protein TatB n=1 Tax=Cypionkella sp. TaxID=2811411 RepID=UPI00132611F9|nr:MAG: Sec-independent protein translocase protein TatB [Paracoccaceae bacterium]
MFGDIGWAELLLIGIVALIVIGPEDLPEMFRQLGRFTAKLRSMAREFSRAMEQAAKESGVNDVAKDLKAATSVKAMGLDKVKEAADRFEKWDPIKNAAKPTTPAKPLTPAPMPATPEPVAAVVAPVEAPAVVHGPATQALLDKQAAKKAILAETADKLKAVDSAELVSKPAPKPRAKRADVVPAADAAPKSRAPRKPRKADQA